MFKVIYQLPLNQIREINISVEELHRFLSWRWLAERIVSIKKMRGGEKDE